ncbi:unnamed protein product [Hyaloperonospora brassicae]|uniref:Uncharacterized protein n=1 Tax=Hyaloperonospora brassicae TaxID=162125 RepID=A0AAV0UNY0_HYABA|nr:unnamed protein product [Hyaloperonospora brassicae]
MTTSGGAFSLGISSEEKLSLPLDALIQKTRQQQSKAKQTSTGAKTNKKSSKKQLQQQQQQSTKSHKQQNVKKTVLVPVSKAARAKASLVMASAKRQTVINKRRTGLVLAGKKGKKAVATVQLRPRKTSAVRKLQSPAPPQGKAKGAARGGLDVSNIINHFRSHPKKFDVPKGSNLRITINLHSVKPVVGGHK